jgi:GNAT superfamily N-acetyltransferase
VGYMLSCRDARRVWNPGLIALRHMLTRGTFLRPGTALFYWRGVLDALRDLFARSRRPEFDLGHFPSHTHNNLLPEGRGGGVGREFFYRVFDQLKASGSGGLHGEVWARNVNMIGFLESLGYQRVGEPYPAPGLRHADGSRVYIQLLLRDLTDWVPGSWRKPAQTPQGSGPPKSPAA